MKFDISFYILRNVLAQLEQARQKLARIPVCPGDPVIFTGLDQEYLDLLNSGLILEIKSTKERIRILSEDDNPITIQVITELKMHIVECKILQKQIKVPQGIHLATIPEILRTA